MENPSKPSPPGCSTGVVTKLSKTKRRRSSNPKDGAGPRSGLTPEEKTLKTEKDCGDSKSDVTRTVGGIEPSGSSSFPKGDSEIGETINPISQPEDILSDSSEGELISSRHSTASTTAEITDALGDLTTAQEEDLHRRHTGADDDEPPAKKSYAQAIRSDKPHEILYVHPLGDDRIPLSADDYRALIGRLETYSYDLILRDKEVPTILWYSHKDGRGLIATQNKRSSELITQMIGKITLKGGKRFKVWHKGQFGNTKLVTGMIGERVAHGKPASDILSLLLRQNKLSGVAQGPKLSELRTRGNEISQLKKFTFFVDQALWEDLQKRCYRPNRVWLHLGLARWQFSLSLGKPPAEALPSAEGSDRP